MRKKSEGEKKKKSFNKEMSLRRALHEKGQRHNLKFALK